MLIDIVVIRLYPNMSEGSALLASTGDAEFNSHLRSVASRLGLLLNDFGLWKFCRTLKATDDLSDLREVGDSNKNNDEEGRWELVGSKTENEIFEGLGMEYVEPSRRNFSFIASRQKGGKKN